MSDLIDAAGILKGFAAWLLSIFVIWAPFAVVQGFKDVTSFTLSDSD